MTTTMMITIRMVFPIPARKPPGLDELRGEQASLSRNEEHGA
jgi:hypothetical protein